MNSENGPKPTKIVEKENKEFYTKFEPNKDTQKFDLSDMTSPKKLEAEKTLRGAARRKVFYLLFIVQFLNSENAGKS